MVLIIRDQHRWCECLSLRDLSQGFAPSVVITMNTTWYTKYRNRPEFMAYFETEQDYVDAMFILIVYTNYGILLNPDKLCRERG